MKHTKTIKNVRTFLKFLLVLSCIQLAFLVFTYSLNLFDNTKFFGSLLKVESSYTLNSKQMNALVESGYPNCIKRNFPKGNVQRTFNGVGYDFNDKQFLWKYNDYNLGACVPQSIDYNYLVTAKSTTGIMLFIFKLIKILFTVGGIYLLHQIISNALKQHPFIKQNSTKLKWIAYLIFGYTFLDWFYRDIIIEIINEINLAAGNTYYIGFNDEKISFTLLLVGFLVLIISSVFKYGYQLKAENDLTI